MFWVIYVGSSVFISLIISMVSKKNYLKIFTILIIFLLTPAQIEVSGSSYAPSFFTFIFNIIFEQDFSIRVLKPLLLTLPFCLLSLFIFSALKRRFF